MPETFSVPTQSGKRYVTFNHSEFWRVMDSARAQGEGPNVHDLADAFNAATGGKDEDGEPIEIWVFLQASAKTNSPQKETGE